MVFFLSGRLVEVLLYKNNIDFYSCQQWQIQGVLINIEFENRKEVFEI